MTNLTAFQRWVLALLACVVLVTVCIAYVDRPVAEFLETHVRHTTLWIVIDRALSPLDLVVVSALLFLFGCGIWAASGHQLRRWADTPLLCSWSAIWAVAADIIFKQIFGRGWPDPTYVHDHLYAFHFLRGGPHWNSFPSGTAAISVAVASVLWIARPHWRVVSLLVVVFLSVAVVVANYHWISDVIAGAFLGVSIGWSTVRLRDPRNRLLG